MEWIKLMGSTFYQESVTKDKLIGFIRQASQLSMGEMTKTYEDQFAQYQGLSYCITYNSGSSANLALIQALLNLGRLKKGDKVAFSALTWATNVMPLIQLGLEPVPVDVELDTLNVSSDLFRKTIQETPVQALFITNALGFCDDMDEIVRLCQEKHILLIEDNCESLGSVYRGRKLGNFGLASTFSFFVGHHLSTIEGGAVCTSDPELADALKMVRAHGWDRNLSPEVARKMRAEHHIDDFYGRYTFYDLAYNFRPMEINSFIGIEQLQFIQETIAIREKNFDTFHQAVQKNPDALPLDVSHMELVSNFAYPLLLKTPELRQLYVQKAIDQHIEVRPIIGGNMCNQPFFKKYVGKRYSMPNSEAIHQNGLYFPNHPELTADEIQRLTTVMVGRN